MVLVVAVVLVVVLVVAVVAVYLSICLSATFKTKLFCEVSLIFELDNCEIMFRS